MNEHRTGYVSIIGRPNVGKSTLLNALLGQKIAAVSPRPQTTRRRQLGILTLKDAQLIFVDTPGLHRPKHKLGEFLNEEAKEALEGVDVILWLVDASTPPTEEDANISALLKEAAPQTPRLLALNKIDMVKADDLPAHEREYVRLFFAQGGVPAAGDGGASRNKVMRISASNRLGLGELLEALIQSSPEREAEYPEEQITDLYEREIAADLIRESCLIQLRDEVPHSLAIRIDEFKERESGMAYIAATIFVERESQKGIVIGEGGRMLKSIGSAARKEIEEMGGRKVFLELRVKVSKDWRNDPNMLRQFGYGKRK
ncbi:MAG: GTPase Era [Chloroflexi bacterium]|nr:GTPase Era [Chloroflexota bacterium]MDL1942659.1 GTPase Era [Chloroflexi bacterium CFX2]